MEFHERVVCRNRLDPLFDEESSEYDQPGTGSWLTDDEVCYPEWMERDPVTGETPD